VNPYHWGHTNWASFAYKEISFKDSKLLALWTPPFDPNLKFTVTLFDDRKHASSLVIPISLSDTLLLKAQGLATSTGLFTVE
jgi:hypothetical protein